MKKAVEPSLIDKLKSRGKSTLLSAATSFLVWVESKIVVFDFDKFSIYVNGGKDNATLAWERERKHLIRRKESFYSTLRPGMMFICKHQISFDVIPGDSKSWEKISPGDTLMYLFITENNEKCIRLTGLKKVPCWLITSAESGHTRVRKFHVSPYQVRRLFYSSRNSVRTPKK